MVMAVRIILIAIIITQSFFIIRAWLQERRRKNIELDAEMIKAETYIMSSDRDNSFAALRADCMIKAIKEKSKSKERRRQTEQLVILWKSKFIHLFNK